MQTTKDPRISERTSKTTAPGRPSGIGAQGILPHSHDALELYLRDIKKAKTLTLAEEAALAARIRNGDMRAVNELVQANLKFVVAVCRNYRSHGLSMGDLINEGNLGMLRAAKRFDGGMQFKFISYAVWWIRQAILTALAEQTRTLKLSTGKVNMISRIGKANQRLEQKLGRSPGLAEVAADLDMSELAITECLQLAAAPMSLAKPTTGESEGTLEDMLEDKEADRPDADILRELSGKNLAEVLGTLQGQEESVIRLYYGIGRESCESMLEIAGRFGVTRERVRQIKSKALDRLRHSSRLERLELYRD